MKYIISLVATFLWLFASIPKTLAEQVVPTIIVDTTLAPNAYGSPSYDAWVANAITGMENGGVTTGAPGPTQFSLVTGPISIYDSVVTGFDSWMGQANPGSVFGSAYANELGDRPSFPLAVIGNTKGTGPTVSIADLSFNATSSDPGDLYGFGFGVGSYTYNDSYVGVDFNADGSIASIINSGPNTQSVDAIFGRGSGNGLPIYDSDPGATEQDKIDQAPTEFGVNGIPDIYFTGTYSIDGASGSGTFDLTQNVSEVGSSAELLGIGLLALLCVALATRRSKQLIPA